MRPETFGERVARLRRRAGIRQYELAARIGVSKAALSTWERGHLPLKVTLQCERLAQQLGVTGHYLRFGVEAADLRLMEREKRRRPRWSYPDETLIELAREGRREIEVAEGFARPPP